MSNTTKPKRPSLTPKPSTKRVQDEKQRQLDTGFRVTIDGEAHEVRYGDLTPALTAELRRNAGVGWQGLQAQLAVDPDIDLVSAFVWLSRRIKGDKVAFRDVVVTYAQMFDLEPGDIEVIDGEVESDPEA